MTSSLPNRLHLASCRGRQGSGSDPEKLKVEFVFLLGNKVATFIT
jgi:hypothetical protein